MIEKLNRLIQKYDAATIFVSAATVVVIIELSLMRLLVPQASSAQEIDSGLLMDQVFNIENVVQTTEQIESWEDYSLQLVSRLSNASPSWQKELIVMNSFGQNEVDQEVKQEIVDYKQEQMAAADYAANQLYLQSVMTGKTPLANINGKIYRIGDDILIRGGEITMRIVSMGSDFAVMELAENADIQRTIYLARNPKMTSGLSSQ